MKYRKFGKQDWKVSEVGYGMWGMAGWSGSNDEQSFEALDKAIELGCNFFDTAWAYGAGKSEQILSEVVKRHKEQKLYLATKIPPMLDEWPPKKSRQLEEVFSYNHIIEYAEKSLSNLGTESIDLLHFHVWEDHWAESETWQKAIEKLKTDGKVQSFGISVNRWEPANCMNALKTGLIDSIQVIYNVFDQAPEDELLPYCQANDIAVIARVPFDEGSLTGALSKESTWPEGDFRNVYFGEENLNPTLDRVDSLKKDLPEGISLAEMALRFIISNPAITTTIPGMRRVENAEKNMKVAGNPLNEEQIKILKKHRWDRVPTSWSC